ncbi:phage head-tail connector protein [Cytobacillus horneckiae]|uniref:phage head-tail connector protein n=1 Tax=Cytobacillus horneckiae TaxID=549687 RepID=UPI0039A2E07B
MALVDEIAKMAEVDKTKHEAYLSTMIPILIKFAEDKCNNKFDAEKLPAGVKIFIAESIKHKLNSKGLSSRSMGSVSYSYDTDLPDKVVNNLKPYRRLRF